MPTFLPFIIGPSFFVSLIMNFIVTIFSVIFEDNKVVEGSERYSNVDW